MSHTSAELAARFPFPFYHNFMAAFSSSGPPPSPFLPSPWPLHGHNTGGSGRKSAAHSWHQNNENTFCSSEFTAETKTKFWRSFMIWCNIQLQSVGQGRGQ